MVNITTNEDNAMIYTIYINDLITGDMRVSISAPAYHADTWYKYANDTEWRTVSISGTISSVNNYTPTT
jgi:hypothetical protein